MKLNQAVFISCAPNQFAQARVVKRHLTEAGLSVDFDEARVGRGPGWLTRATRHLKRARAMLILLGKDAPISWQRAELTAATRALGINPQLLILPVLFDGYDERPIAPLLERFTPHRLPPDSRRLDEALADLGQRLNGPPSTTPFVGEGAEGRYQGLSPYRSEDAHRYFGREQEVVEALGRLDAGGGRRWLSVEGPPGVGKRSFLHAGLAPALCRGGLPQAPSAWACAALAPTCAPLRALAEALATALDGVAEELIDLLRHEGGLTDLITEHLPADQGLLLIVDELDQLAAWATDPVEAALVDAMLAQALRDFDRRLFLFTSGAPAGLEQLGALAAEGRRARFELGAPTLGDLQLIVEAPFTQIGRAWPKALRERLVEDALAHPRPLGPLSWILTVLAAQPDPSLDQYHALGGLQGGLSEALDAGFNALGSDERGRARGLLLALVQGGRGREDAALSLPLDEAVFSAGDGPRAGQLVDRLTQPTPNPEGPPHPPLLALACGPPQLVTLYHRALPTWWARMRGWLEMDRPLLERRWDVEALVHRLDPEAELPPELLHFCTGADLIDEHRAHLRAALRTQTRHVVEAAELQQRGRDLAAKEREEVKREALQQRHEAATRALDARIRKLRMIAFGLGALTLLCAALTYHALSTAGEQEAQLLWAQQERLDALDQLREMERSHLEAEQRRKSAEEQRRVMNTQRAKATSAEDAAEQSADEVLRWAMEILSEADTHLARIRGDEAEYTRRVYSEALIKRLEDKLEGGPNARLTFLLAHQRAQAAKLALSKNNHRRGLSYLEASIEGIKGLPGVDEEGEGAPSRLYLEALAEHQMSYILALKQEHKQGRGDAAKVDAAYADWMKTLRRLAPLDGAEGARRLSDALSRWGRFAFKNELEGRGVAPHRESVEVLRPLKPKRGEALTLAWRLTYLGEAAAVAEDPATAKAALEEALTLAEAGRATEERGKLTTRIKRRLKALEP